MSTMKIITPKGAIREIDKVVPVVEKRIEFNGRKRRLVETAKDLSVQLFVRNMQLSGKIQL